MPGLGTIFSTIYRGLLPLAKGAVELGVRGAKSGVGKKVLRAAKRSALDAGLDITNEALRGENIGRAVKSRLSTVGNDFVSNVGRELKPKKKTPKSKTKGKAKKKKVYSGPIRTQRGGGAGKKWKGKGKKKKGGGKKKSKKPPKKSGGVKKAKKKKKTKKTIGRATQKALKLWL